MEYIIAILVWLGIIWAVYYYSNKAENKKKDGRVNELASNTASATEKSSSTKSTKTDRVQVSTDQLYANSNGMWVCRYCETLNDAGKEECAACGAKKG